MKPAVALGKLRALATSLAGELREGAHFGGLMFKTAGGKPFASWDDRGGDGEIVVQLEPDHVDALLEKDSRVEKYTRAKGCVLLRVSAFDWKEIAPLVQESFHRVMSAPASKNAATKTAKKTATKTAAKKKVRRAGARS